MPVTWLTVVLFAVIAVLLGTAMLAMAIGVIGHGKCLRGSCGGTAAHDREGHDVRYRNIWIKEMEIEKADTDFRWC